MSYALLPTRRPGRTARMLFYGAVLTSTWTSLTVLGQAVSDLLLLAAAPGIFGAGAAERSAGVRSFRKLRFLLVAGWLLAVAVCLTAARADDAIGEFAVAGGFAASILVVPLVVMAVVREARDAIFVLALLAASAAISGAAALADLRFGWHVSPDQLTWNEYPPIAESRAVGLTGHPNILGYVCAVVIPLFPALLLATRSAARGAMMFGASLSGAALLLSGSRGGAAGAVAGLLYLAFRAGPTAAGAQVRRAIVWAALLLAVMVFFIPGASLVERVLGGQDTSASNDSRVLGLREALASVGRSFPAGTGFVQVYEVHSGLIALLVGGGAIAVAGVAVWLLGVRRIALSATRTSDPTRRLLASACMSSGVAALVFLAVSPIIYHRYVVVPIGIAIALSRMPSSAGPEESVRTDCPRPAADAPKLVIGELNQRAMTK